MPPQQNEKSDLSPETKFGLLRVTSVPFHTRFFIRTIVWKNEAEIWPEPKSKLRTIWALDFRNYWEVQISILINIARTFWHEKLIKLRTAQTEPRLTGFSIEGVYVKILLSYVIFLMYMFSNVTIRILSILVIIFQPPKALNNYLWYRKGISQKREFP